MARAESTLIRVQVRVPEATLLGRHLSQSSDRRRQLLELATLGLGLAASSGLEGDKREPEASVVAEPPPPVRRYGLF